VKKRSKLDLSSGIKKDKAQAAGFSSKTAPEPEAAHKSQSKGSQASSARQQSRSSEAALQQQPSRAMIFTTVAVVAVVAVSLFVLKRR
jgi:hypothetical protein